jgi:hypothetical protein
LSSTETIFLARNLGIKLELLENNQDILATPKEKITDELRESIKANHDDLLKTLLFRRAGEWVGSRPFSTPEEADEALNAAWYEADLEEFREALREWVRTGLENGKRKEKAA